MPDMTYSRLQKAVTEIAKRTARDTEAIQHRTAQIQVEVEDTAAVAESIGAMRVDKDTIAETRDLARIMNGLWFATAEHVRSGDNTVRAAKAAYDQARTTHAGFQEAVSRSNVDGVYDINREWFRQD